MSDSTFQEIEDANQYEKHVAACDLCETIPPPPETVEEMLVITEGYPHFLADYLPLIVNDTPTRRAAVALVAEIPDWL